MKMVGRMITVANIEKVTIETLAITVIVVTVVIVAILVLALYEWAFNIAARAVIIPVRVVVAAVVVVLIIVTVLVVAVAVVAVTIRTVLFHPVDLTIYPMCSRRRCQETMLHYMHSCIVTLEKVHAHSPPDSKKKIPIFPIFYLLTKATGHPFDEQAACSPSENQDPRCRSGVFCMCRLGIWCLTSTECRRVS